MTCTISRRRFLAGAFAASCAGLATRAGAATEVPLAAQTLDIHVHLFGCGEGGSGCRLSRTVAEGDLFKFFQANLRLRKRAASIDEGYVLALAEQIQQSGLEKAVILAQDAVYNDRGQPDWERTHFYVPNDYLFRVVARYPDLMIPCVSINPDRADAIDELDRCATQGARLLKIHPPTQCVDLADRKHTRFFRRAAELGVVIMVHTGHEHCAPLVIPELADPRKLELALDSGCTVVACHCGTGWLEDAPDMVPAFLELIRKYKNLWGDTAVLGSGLRLHDFQRLLADTEAPERLLHGSDFPFPAVPLAFVGTVGLKNSLLLQTLPNWIRRDFALKEALGVGLASAQRAYRFVANALARA